MFDAKFVDTRNKSKTRDCSRNFSPMILKGNQWYSHKLFPNFTCHHLITQNNSLPCVIVAHIILTTSCEIDVLE